MSSSSTSERVIHPMNCRLRATSPLYYAIHAEKSGGCGACSIYRGGGGSCEFALDAVRTSLIRFSDCSVSWNSGVVLSEENSGRRATSSYLVVAAWSD